MVIFIFGLTKCDMQPATHKMLFVCINVFPEFGTRADLNTTTNKSHVIKARDLQPIENVTQTYINTNTDTITMYPARYAMIK